MTVPVLLNESQPLPSPPKEFSIRCGSSPLLTAASPLLSLLQRVTQLCHHRPLAQLHHELMYELKAFEAQSTTFAKTPHVLGIAKQWLSQWLDEALQKELGNDWQPFLLSATLTIPAQERLKELETHPAENIELIELYYIAQQLGFCQNHPNLYACIQHTRQSQPYPLPPLTTTLPHSQSKKNWQTLGLILAASSVVYLLMYTLLNQLAYGLLPS